MYKKWGKNYYLLFMCYLIFYSFRETLKQLEQTHDLDDTKKDNRKEEERINRSKVSIVQK